MPRDQVPLDDRDSERSNTSVTGHDLQESSAEHRSRSRGVRVGRNSGAEENHLRSLAADASAAETEADWHAVQARRGWLARLCGDVGSASNLVMGLLLIVFGPLSLAIPESVALSFIASFALFGFSGGITNWVAVRMLFDRVPFLYGSGVIPRRFREIRAAVKNAVMRAFFDREYLERYLRQKSKEWIENLDIGSKVRTALETERAQSLISTKLGEALSKPELAMMLAMVGMTPQQLVPMLSPFVVSMGADAVPELLLHIDIGELIRVDAIQQEVDSLMTEKLEELTPDRVKILIEDVVREHLGWLVLWGNIFGGVIGLITRAVQLAVAS